MEAALEGGAEDVVTNDDGSYEVITDPGDFVDVKEALESAGHEAENAEVTMRPDNNTALDAKSAETMIKLLDVLEDLDDVQKVYSNADISDDILDQLD